MKKLAVTGITGKNGKVLFDYFVSNETAVLSKWSTVKFLVRDKNKAEFISNSNSGIPYEIIEGNAFDYDSVMNLVSDCDTVLHISGLQQSVNIAKACVKAGVKRLISVHTTGIFSKYKAAGEEYRRIESELRSIADANGLILTILRPTMIYGTLQDHNISEFIKLIDLSKRIPVISGGRYDIQPVNCHDLGKAFYQVLMNPQVCDGNEYVLSGERPIQIRELFAIISKELGNEKKFISCPYCIAYFGAWILYALSGKKRDFREKVQRMCESRAYSHQKATDDFGYEPMKVEDGIHREVKLYLDSKQV